MIHEDDLNDIECPECDSPEVTVYQWSEPDRRTASAKAECSCGFEAREDYSLNELANIDRGGRLGDLPVEYVHNGEVAERWEAEIKFSPRIFLARVAK